MRPKNVFLGLGTHNILIGYVSPTKFQVRMVVDAVEYSDVVEVRLPFHEMPTDELFVIVGEAKVKLAARADAAQ